MFPTHATGYLPLGRNTWRGVAPIRSDFGEEVAAVTQGLIST
jgi:hypothetical protein